jgi:hypothetical protein
VKCVTISRRDPLDAIPIEEGAARSFLKPGKGAAYGGLGNTETPCRRRSGALTDDGAQDLKIAIDDSASLPALAAFAVLAFSAIEV